jgi:hypothetical protein
MGWLLQRSHVDSRASNGAKQNNTPVAEWRYPVELLDALERFGLKPTEETPPTLVRDQLSDLYRYEIRRLRGRLLAGEFPKADYAGLVIQLRKHYWPLSATPRQWELICSRAHGGPERDGGAETSD